MPNSNAVISGRRVKFCRCRCCVLLRPTCDRKRARLDLQVPGQAGRHQVRLLDLDPLEVGDGQEHRPVQVGIDGGRGARSPSPAGRTPRCRGEDRRPRAAGRAAAKSARVRGRSSRRSRRGSTTAPGLSRLDPGARTFCGAAAPASAVAAGGGGDAEGGGASGSAGAPPSSGADSPIGGGGVAGGASAAGGAAAGGGVSGGRGFSTVVAVARDNRTGSKA